MNKLTIFANFSIDSEERFLRLKDSFFSFRQGNIDNWVINIRGSFREKVKIFFATHITTKVDIFFYESESGWFCTWGDEYRQYVDTGANNRLWTLRLAGGF